MDNVVCLGEYRGKKLLEEIQELKIELESILEGFDLDPKGYFLTLEEMEQMERAWEEKESQK